MNGETRRRTIETLRRLAGERPMSAARLRDQADRLEAEPLRCLDEGPDCEGPVELRLNPRTWASWPRCDVHWRKWLDAIDGVNRRYPDQANPPAGFDPSAAGESWDEE